MCQRNTVLEPNLHDSKEVHYVGVNCDASYGGQRQRNQHTTLTNRPAALALRVQPHCPEILAAAGPGGRLIPLPPRAVVTQHHTILTNRPAALALRVQPQDPEILAAAGPGGRLIPLPPRAGVTQHHTILTNRPAALALRVQ